MIGTSRRGSNYNFNMLQTDFSLQHFPYFSLHILKSLNTPPFGFPTVGSFLTQCGLATLKKLLSPQALPSVVILKMLNGRGL
jgi:hypothetical protein